MTWSFPPDHVVSKIATRTVLHVLGPTVARIARPRTPADWRDLGSPHQPIFIVGPPRCGSTILYQAMTNYFDVLYIDNLAARWARDLPFGVSRSMRRFGRTPHNNFRAHHGDTAATGGWHAPSECGNLWYRWIPKNQHYVGPDEVTRPMIDELREEVTAIQSQWDAPLLIKNLHVGQRLAWVSRAFPKARYVCVHRHSVDVVESILNARHQLGIPSNELWSTRPPVYDDLLSLSERKMVEKQVDRVVTQIETSLGLLSPTTAHHVRYEDFGPSLIDTLGKSLGLTRRTGGTLPQFGNQK